MERKLDATEVMHLGEVATKVKKVLNEDILRHQLHSSVKNWLTDLDLKLNEL